MSYHVMDSYHRAEAALALDRTSFTIHSLSSHDCWCPAYLDLICTNLPSKLMRASYRYRSWLWPHLGTGKKECKCNIGYSDFNPSTSLVRAIYNDQASSPSTAGYFLIVQLSVGSCK